MLNILKKVWNNTSFRWSNLVRNFFGGGFLLGVTIAGIIWCFFWTQGENRMVAVKKNTLNCIRNAWQTSESGEVYLNKYFQTSTFPLMVDKEDIKQEAFRHVKAHNLRVEGRANNRKAGLVVKHNPKWDIRLEAVYTADGRIWLKSTNTKLGEKFQKEWNDSEKLQ